jgi:hypothetical protein
MPRAWVSTARFGEKSRSICHGACADSRNEAAGCLKPTAKACVQTQEPFGSVVGLVNEAVGVDRRSGRRAAGRWFFEGVSDVYR